MAVPLQIYISRHNITRVNAHHTSITCQILNALIDGGRARKRCAKGEALAGKADQGFELELFSTLSDLL